MARLIAQFVTLTTYRVTKLTRWPLLFIESSPLPLFAQSMRDKMIRVVTILEVDIIIPQNFNTDIGQEIFRRRNDRI